MYFYDYIQKSTTIDTKDQSKYESLKPWIDDILLVNIDSTVIDPETDMIQREYLTKFFTSISPYVSSVKCIFIDYAFFSSTEQDSLFIESLKPFKDKLILPYIFDIQDINLKIQGPIKSDRVKNIRQPIYNESISGYVRSYEEPFTNTHRYFLYKIDTDDKISYNSVPYLIATKYKNVPEEKLEKNLNKIVELKYILRNTDKINKERARLVYEMRDFYKEIPKFELGELLSGKILFIGLFEGYKNKYGLEPDKFRTPIKNNLSGALIQVNAYLNLVKNLLIKDLSVAYNFILYFIISILLIWYNDFIHLKTPNSSLPNFVYFIINNAIILVLLPVIFFLLFYYFSLRTHIIMPLLIILQNRIIYLFLSRKKHFKPLSL